MVGKYYFIIPQLVVIVAYLLVKVVNWDKEESYLFENKLLYSIVITSCFYVGINYNLDYQLFCNPVKWTYWILIPVAIWLISFPFIKEIRSLFLLNSICYGISLFVLIYIILFGGIAHLSMMVLVGFIALPLYILTRKLKEKYGHSKFDFLNFFGLSFGFPFYLLYLLIKSFKCFNKTFSVGSFVILMMIGIYSSMKINSIERIYVQNRDHKTEFKALRKNPVDEYFLELFLGLHWKYHTQICLYDGWRPPYHNPFIGFRRWFNVGNYLIDYGEFQNLRNTYKEVFPENSIGFKCKCAKHQTF